MKKLTAKQEGEIIAQEMALKALNTCYRVFNMDVADTYVSMECGMAISLLELSLGIKKKKRTK